jgi:hypothetical protein
MYLKLETQLLSPEKFELGKLDPNNRWVMMSELIPWSEFEEEYSLSKLSEKPYKNLLVITELYRQQLEMYEEKSRRIDDRIVGVASLQDDL